MRMAEGSKFKLIEAPLENAVPRRKNSRKVDGKIEASSRNGSFSWTRR